ncbi:CTTNBP 2 amino-terminal-like protein [Arabidopsis thaliana]|uniref:CTTNBP 2 amino-terminal-like protein n=1 Tax=Arabidopsis thaliana TaxID=3702 RepID=F4I7D6_ARATH|nr:CTTNBP 2 amino-terminal-like protein [Arabidopsis thaliana]AEE28687.1 CTTNBP 2 amino-terminal-like protein [Arabidopsis thaliana]|eukprot:NP_172579.2 CTTNBP 2 amino-terminal-like protein [Arabidopsis thaliana]
MRDLEHLKTNLNHQWPPIGAPMNLRREEPWKSQFDDSVNAVSFGFVATAILISMFLVMAIFERLIRTTTTSTTNSDSSSSRVLPGMDSRVGFNGAATKLGYQSPKASNNRIVFSFSFNILKSELFIVIILRMTVYSNGVSVLMPGDDIPTFIAHPAPVPCPPQNISQSQHQHGSSKDSSSSNSIQEC